MKLGCCTSAFDDKIFKFNDLGFDYAEIGVGGLAEYSVDDIKRRREELDEHGISCLAGNVLFPGSIRLTGESADFKTAEKHLEDVLYKANILGLETVVFGSSGSRKVDEGFPYEKAFDQLCGLCADVIIPIADKYGIVCCVEPLNKKECNILNTCAETEKLVRRLNSKNIRLLLDLYHFDCEGEDHADVLKCGDILGHLHIASAKNNRNVPQENDGEDYGEFFRYLKEIGYNGKMSLEGNITGDFEETVKASSGFLKTMQPSFFIC